MRLSRPGERLIADKSCGAGRSRLAIVDQRLHRPTDPTAPQCVSASPFYRPQSPNARRGPSWRRAKEKRDCTPSDVPANRCLDIAVLSEPPTRSDSWKGCRASRCGFSCRQLAAPGEVMVPWNEPEVKNVTPLARRSTVKLPWAPENRPVPPVMV